MPYDPQHHHRQSIRLPGYDYSQPGTYFLTICVHDRDCIFGDIVNGEMRPQLQLDQWVVMPNHLHGIVSIGGEMTLERERAHSRVPLQASSGARRPPLRESQSVSSFVAGFKSAVTSRVNRYRNTPRLPVWQSNFYEHVIRNNRTLQAIREYIVTNPLRWHADRENPSGDGTDDVGAFVASVNVPEEKERGADVPREREVTSLEGEARAHGSVTLREETRAHGSVPLCERNVMPFRIGHGYDLHRLQPGGTLMLAGVQVADDLSPVAHSDGDVVIHALVDALLGAMGWGDIGEHFPNSDAQWKNAPSRVFLEEVYAKVTAAGYVLVNADITVLAERPTLKSFKPAMREFLAGVLGGCINIKAGTNEGCDAIGRGEAIAAHAVVLLALAD